MFRPIMAIVAGYFSIAALNSLIHIITSVYFKTGLSLSGISHLSSMPWTIGITGLQLLLGLFGGLLATTIAQSKQHVAILGFILLIAIIGFFNYTVLSAQEPLWYLIAAPGLRIAGIFAGYRLIQLQNKSNNTHEG
ncbi:MAG: hypothetical protein U5J63_00315 [Fodinibius sp.]|nr:hypothetical protein [Fodinibius sp.]